VVMEWFPLILPGKCWTWYARADDLPNKLSLPLPDSVPVASIILNGQKGFYWKPARNSIETGLQISGLMKIKLFQVKV